MVEWLPVRLYRFQHDHGGAKDWAVAHDSQTVRIYYGKMDSVLRTTTIPRACCREDSPAAEAEARKRRKVAAGYTDLGDYALNLDNRRQLRPLTEPPEEADEDVPKPSSASPSLYWERVPRPAVDWERLTRDHSRVLREAGIDIADTLKQAGLIRDCVLETLAEGRWVIHLVIDDTTRWSFGEGGAPQPGTLAADGSGRGIVADHARQPAVVLFLLALARIDRSLVIADEAGAVVGEVPGDLPVNREVLIALNLVSRSARELLAGKGATDGDWFF